MSTEPNIYPFIARSFWLRISRKKKLEIDRLMALTQLVSQIENVLCELDAAFEEAPSPLVGLRLLDGTDTATVIPIQSFVNERLLYQYKQLYESWKMWLTVAEITA